MLIVCNGAAKSGSTWLYNIVDRLLPCEWPPKDVLTSSRKHPTIKPVRLADYLALGHHHHRRVITKTHYGRAEQRSLLLADPAVRVIDMERNLYDVIVSTYYDAKGRNGFRGSFARFYWYEGRTQADYLLRYHRLWGDGHPQVCVTSFEALKADFAGEVAKIAAFLGIEVTPARVAEIEQETSLHTLRDRYKDEPLYADAKNPFFRKGEVGDWKNHFDDAMLADIRRIERRGLPRHDWRELWNGVQRRVYARLPALSPYPPKPAAPPARQL
jgi:hypothetical protein